MPRWLLSSAVCVRLLSVQPSVSRECSPLMKSPKMWIAVGVGVTSLCCWFLLRGTPEPQFEGRSLSQWLEPTFSYDHKKAIIVSKTSDRFQSAMQAIGTNAIPHLLRMLSAKEYPYRSFLIERFGDVNNWWVNRIGLNRPWFRRTRAAKGFVALGERATNAIPAILQTGASGEMVDVLQGIGPGGLPIVLKEIEHGSESVRFNGLFGLQARVYDRKTVVDTWIRYTSDPSARVRWAATTLLWAAPLKYRDEVVAALERLEHDKDKKVAAMATLTLQRVATSTSDFENTLVPP